MASVGNARIARGLPEERHSFLTKCFEDAAQGIILKNDGQVRRHRTDLVLTAQEAERVEFAFLAL